MLDAPQPQLSAKLVGQFAVDLTPPEELEKQREERAFAIRPPGARLKGGRATDEA
ncbi:MAG: hypothetical protein WCD79_23205 [Chthoniobacteraceae bacterium]